ncbi:MAG: hypothetical protein HFH41_07760 [Lachnospiraceae bacterium]|nr:hypothetical protein [Lachnospiraceae bacterium]
MKKIIKRMTNGLIAICLIAALSATTVYATMVAYGSEKAGYMVCTKQLRKKTDTFDDSALNKTYRSYMNYGVKVWKDSGVVTLKRKSSSINKVVMTKSDSRSLAWTYTWGDSRNGKIQQFEIWFNTRQMSKRGKSGNQAIAAHEIGHAIGLLDLYEKRNRDKLMYGIENKEVVKPTKADIKGGKYATRK